MSLVDTITSLMLAKGNANAEGLLREAALRQDEYNRKRAFWGQTIGTLANVGMQIPGIVQQAKTAGAQREALQAETTQRQQQTAMQQQQMMQQQRMQQMSQYMNTLAQKYMEPNDQGVVTLNRGKVQSDALQQGIPADVIQKVLEPFDKMDESVRKSRDAQEDYRAEAANGALVAINSGMPPANALAGIMAHAGANAMISQDQATAIAKTLAAGQDVRPILAQMASKKYPNVGKLEKGAAGEGFVNPVTQQVTAIVPQKAPAPTAAEFAEIASDPTKTPEQRGQAQAALEALQGPRTNTLEETMRHNKAMESAALLRAQRTGQSAPSTEGLSPEAVANTAAAYRLLGTRGIPTRITADDRVKIMNEAARQSKAVGDSPATAVTRQLATRADSAALNQLQKMSSSAEAYENKALGQADIIEGLSGKVSRTKSPLVNDVIQGIRERVTGDEDATQLANAIQTFSAEYAKIMEGSTGSVSASSDSARKAAQRLINTGMSKGQLSSVLDLMKKEMRLTLQGYDVAKGSITDRVGGGGTSAPSQPKREVWEPDGKGGYRQKSGGD